MCFSLGWIESLLIWLVVVCAVVAVIKLLLPYAFAQLGNPGALVVQVLNIVMWAVVLIFVIYIAFDLLACLVGFPRMLAPAR
jgi:branched-subunit amino acid transport protein AzlD